MGTYKSKKETYSKEELLKKISMDLRANYEIGLHQIGVFGTKESVKKVHKNNFFSRVRKLKPKDFCECILRNGFMNRYSDINHTLMPFGDIKKIENNKDFRKDNFLDYFFYGYEDYMKEIEKNLDTMIIAVPSEVEIEGKKYNLGNLKFAQDIDVEERSLMREQLFNSKDIPKEFVYGYVHSHDGKCDLVRNLKHYSVMDEKQKGQYIKGFLFENNVTIEMLKNIESSDSFKEELENRVIDGEELLKSDIESIEESSLKSKEKITEKSSIDR